MMTRFVLLAVGDDTRIYQQAHGACLSLLAHRPAGAFEIAVFTSRPAWFRWLDGHVRVEEVTASRLADWKGAHRYLYRAKICALREAVRTGPANHVLLDSDVLVRRPLDDLLSALADGTFLVHRVEKALDARSGTRKALRPLFHVACEDLRILPSTVVLNTGVIGVPATRHDAVDKALRLNDFILDRGVRHFAVEQIAWSVVLGPERVVPASGYIDHYWGNKRAFLEVINDRLADAIMRRIDPDEAAREMARRPIDLPLRVWKRWWHEPLLKFLRIPR